MCFIPCRRQVTRAVTGQVVAIRDQIEPGGAIADAIDTGNDRVAGDDCARSCTKLGKGRETVVCHGGAGQGYRGIGNVECPPTAAGIITAHRAVDQCHIAIVGANGATRTAGLIIRQGRLLDMCLTIDKEKRPAITGRRSIIEQFALEDVQSRSVVLIPNCPARYGWTPEMRVWVKVACPDTL